MKIEGEIAFKNDDFVYDLEIWQNIDLNIRTGESHGARILQTMLLRWNAMLHSALALSRIQHTQQAIGPKL